MSGWLYYSPRFPGQRGQSHRPTCEAIETVGKRELRLITRARESRSGLLATDSGRAGNKERLAARRLTLREKPLLRRCEIRGTEGARTTIWTLTERGRTCWLRVKS